MELVQNKFFNNSFTRELPENHSIFNSYNEYGQKLDGGKNIDLTISISNTVLYILSNLHDRIMTSNQSQGAKLAEVVVLSAATVTFSATFAVAETIIRAVPAVFAVIYVYASAKDVYPDNGDTLNILCFSPFINAILSISGILLSKDMLVKKNLYLFSKRWIP